MIRYILHKEKRFCLKSCQHHLMTRELQQKVLQTTRAEKVYSCDLPRTGIQERPNALDVETTVWYPPSKDTNVTVDGETACVRNALSLRRDRE